MTDQTSRHITDREQRKRDSIGATYRPDPGLDRALAWAKAGDPRYDALPAATKMAAGYYKIAKSAATGKKETS